MDLYIEKEFLDNFFADYEERKYQEIVFDLFTKYGDRKAYIDFEEENFSAIVKDNPFFSLLGNILPPIPISSIKDELINSNEFDQTLVFCQKEEPWFEEIINKGVLCFCFQTYESKIREIVDNLHFDIDLSEGFNGWLFSNEISTIALNKLTIEDSYILSDKNHPNMKENIEQLLNMFIINRSNKIQVNILTKELDAISSHPKHIKEKASKNHKFLNRIFANYNLKFKVIMNDISSLNFHDRFIRSNFHLLKSGVGFNPSRHKISNSEISSKTIFDSYTYKKLRSLNKLEDLHMNELNKKDQSFFKMYP